MSSKSRLVTLAVLSFWAGVGVYYWSVTIGHKQYDTVATRSNPGIKQRFRENAATLPNKYDSSANIDILHRKSEPATTIRTRDSEIASALGSNSSEVSRTTHKNLPKKFTKNELPSLEQLGLSRNFCNNVKKPKTTDIFKQQSTFCAEVFQGSQKAINAAKSWKPDFSFTDDQMLCSVLAKCDNWTPHFQKSAKSELEAKFPLAFVMIVQKNLEQFLRVLRSIYVPQNYYCLTYDQKSSPQILAGLRRIAACFPNILVAEKFEDIYWGHYSQVQTVLNCMQVLKPLAWKYVQIVAWNDIPLRTNAEMVKILKLFNGASDAEGKMGQQYRYEFEWEFRHANYSDEKAKADGMQTRDMMGYWKGLAVAKKPPPPGNQTVIFKGSFAATMSKQLVDFMLTDPKAKEFLNWSKHTLHPDEHVWSTFIFNPSLGYPNALPTHCVLQYLKMKQQRRWWISRYHVWPDTKHPCLGSWPHGSCAFGVGDLPRIAKVAKELFAHKMYLDFEPMATLCMLELHHNRTFGLPDSAKHTFLLDYYANLPSVKYAHLPQSQRNQCPSLS